MVIALRHIMATESIVVT